MALNTITPSNREEEYLSAIAGDEGASAPVPSNRREEWLRRIAEGQGDQTGRLDHIEDQIPVDPEAEDVGKVMTVVADESGEEPVYKWSAEESKSFTPYQFWKNGDVSTPSGTVGNTATSLVPNAEEIRAELYTGVNRTALEVWNIYKKHFYAVANGIEFLPGYGTLYASTSGLLVESYVNILATVSGAEKKVRARLQLTINKTGNTFLQGNSLLNFYDPISGTEIARSDVSAIEKILINIAVR